MPIYEYECPKCGQFEVVQKATDKPLKCNPDCSVKGCPKTAKRLISASAFHLKGSGWYKTDYAKSGTAGTKSAAGSKSADATKGSAAKEGNASSAGDAPASSGSSDSSGDSSNKKGAGCGKGCGCH